MSPPWPDFVPGPGMAVYYATKACVLSFTEALAEELAGTNVTVTALCPGPTATNFGKVAHMPRRNVRSDRSECLRKRLPSTVFALSERERQWRSLGCKTACLYCLPGLDLAQR